MMLMLVLTFMLMLKLMFKLMLIFVMLFFVMLIFVKVREEMRAEHASKDNLKKAVASMPATVAQVLPFDQLHRPHS